MREFFGGARSGFFVEVGANHPQFASQTWHLEQLGWTGVLVEPQPDLADNLRRHRTAKVFAVACSSRANAGQRMKLHVAGALSSLERERMAPGAELERVIEVPIRTLDDVLTEAQAPAPLDLVSLDVEGHELKVLDGFTLARWQPRLILLEDHVGDLSKHRALHRARLPPDPPGGEQRLVCAARRGGQRHAARNAGRSCGNIISRCHSASCATSRAGCASRSRTAGARGARARPAAW